MTAQIPGGFNTGIPAVDNTLVVGIFCADVLVTSAAAWLLVCASGHDRLHALEAGVAWLWSFVALVAGAGVILGMTGGFGETGFLVFHAAALVAIAGARGRRLRHDWTAWRATLLQVRYFFTAPGSARLLGAALGLALLALTAIAACAQPAALDALTYHLPRIGAWLQDEKVHILASPDARLNFVADLPDIVWAWLLGGVGEGFHLVVLAQAIGGILAVGATIGLARQAGLSRSAALLAGALLLGMANVVVQFTAAQTDLFATGIFAASFFLWVAALRRGECSWLGALGAGMALAAKGTVCYMAPSALLWVAWFAWQHRVSWAVWGQTLLAGVLGIGLFALPAFHRNHEAYGGFLGPAAWVKKHHEGFDSVSGQLHKLDWNLTSSLAQNLEPNSQPEPLRSLSLRAATTLVRRLPGKDAYTLDQMDRKGALNSILQRTEPDADAVSFGDVALLLFALGTVVALVKWRRESAPLVLVWSAGVVIFVLFFHVMQQWHPFSFRYLVLMAPWVAVVAAWGIEQLGIPWRRAVWLLAAFATADVAWYVTLHTHQAGWRAVVEPQRSAGYFFFKNWREWSGHLDHPEAPFILALSGEKPISAFFRQTPRREVVFRPDPPEGATAESLLGHEPGWLIVPAARLVGREGRVAASVWLYEGNEGHIFSLAAYRRLAVGEKPQPIVYREHRATTGSSVSYSFLVRTVSGTPTRLTLSNPGQSRRGYAWSTPLAHQRGVLGAGAKVVVDASMPADTVGEIQVVFDPADPSDHAATSPTAELQR